MTPIRMGVFSDCGWVIVVIRVCRLWVRRPVLVCLLGALAATGLGGCRQEPEAESLSAPTAPPARAVVSGGHQQMLALLEEIRLAADREHPFHSDASIRQITRELRQLPPAASASESLRLYAALGAHEVRLGRTADAIKHLQQAVDLLPDAEGQVPDEIVDSILLTMALAQLRVAETENCVNCQGGESCILPIRELGVHRRPEGSRQAIEFLSRLLERSPQHLTGRWLYNLARMTLGEYPDKVPAELLIPPTALASEEEFPSMRNIATEVGLDTFSLSGGAIVDDFDGDGLLDVVVSSWGTADVLRFLRNTGDGRFRDVSEAAGFSGLYGGLNLVQADYDNDDDLDILVLRGAWLQQSGRHPNSLLQNDGSGRFRDVTFETGLGDDHFPTQTAAWADLDNDGDLDLYIGNEGFPDQLFRNDGPGTFVDITRQAGIDNPGMTKGVVWGDYDNDRFPDIYLSNLDGPNRLYRNNRDGTFTNVAAELGVEQPQASFPTWFWDFNNDGALDLYVASYNATVADIAADCLGLPHTAEPDRLYQGDGKGHFRDVASEQRLPRVTQPMGANFGDVDNDGFPDLYLGTGDVPFEALMPNRLLHNGGAKRFFDVTSASRTGHLQKGHGVAFADLDHDGDQDLFIELGGALRGDEFHNALFENPGFGHHWLKVRLRGRQSNRWGLGARLRLEVADGAVANGTATDGAETRAIYHWVNSGGSFGANPLRREIGVGTATRIRRLEVYWPTSDTTQTFHDVPADQCLEITEGDAEYQQRPLHAFRFADRGAP